MKEHNKDKARVIIKDWSLSRWYDNVNFDDNLGKTGKYNYNLCGNAENHPKLGKTYIAHTSPLVKAEIKNNTLYYETLNTIYEAELKYMAMPTNFRIVFDASAPKDLLNPHLENIMQLENKLTRKEEESVEFTPFEMQCIQLMLSGSKDRESEIETEHLRLINEAKKYDNCVYMEVESVSAGSLVAFNIDDHTGVMEPYRHTGMMQDSILYRDKETGVDFRYWPNHSGLETYGWSENIERVVIKNMKGVDITFNHSLIKPRQLMVFERHPNADFSN